MLPTTALYSANVLVAAPPSLQRQGLLSTLHDKWPLLSCSVTADTSQLPMLVRQQAYALIVLDSTLSSLPIAELIRQIRSIRSCQPLLVLTGPRLTPVQRQQLLLAGTVTLLPHTVAPTVLLATITPFVSGTLHWTLPPSITPTRVAPPTPFSNREVEVLRLVVADNCNQEIADKLCLSVRTVESHRRALLQKTGAKTLVGLVVQAVREGWVGVA
ncbi:helix-turn-helix transcriptional regulator [Hymenobacter volaticus]|uniref:Response regulator transcription factor n=1 Tax=Hymenobacter volaticus TaxID=2932254 RepID=A0ABY4G599_9BACT|nr:response regulator transcription factor [Hymenobacter volaticus]UOQ65988.1 response regulator transcription factor [Hymenobacter volaticus]